MYSRFKTFIILTSLFALVLVAIRLFPHPALKDSLLFSTAIYDQNGELLRLSLAPDEQYRLWVPLEEMNPRLIEAVQLYEDQWFEWHPGINPIALTRAALSTYFKGSRQGASTLTMQLARRYYRIQSQNIGGKIQQIAAAIWLEIRYSKKEILEAYLNLAPYGANVEGVGAASLVFFHKPVKNLTLTEVLSLAVIPQNPNKRGLQKKIQADLLTARKRLYQTWLESHPQDKKYQSDIKTRGHSFIIKDLPFRAPHLTDYLLKKNEIETGNDKQIYSSLDLKLQNSLERILEQYIEQNRSKGIHNAAALLIDRHSGQVKALLGSANYFDKEIDGQVNGVFAKRSPGSTLKPFIYGLGLDQGILHPLTVLKDTPTSFGPFTPENFDGSFVGPITAQDALIRSRNIPAMTISAKLSQPNLYEFLKKAQVHQMASEQHYGLALTLGGGEISMLELARLYLMLANGGKFQSISFLKDQKSATQQSLISEEASFIVLKMLERNPRPDLESPAKPAVAWKTGTSWGFRDAWTAGVFDSYVLVVWTGNFNNEGNPVFIGVQTAAPLFFKIVDAIRAQGLRGKLVQETPPPKLKLMEVCTASGDLPNAWCPERSWTWFIPGKSPIKVSSLHRAINIDTRSGKATCETGPHVKTEVYEYWPSDVQQLFRQAGMPRRSPPPLPDCAQRQKFSQGPQILKPKYNTRYLIELSKTRSINLQASVKSTEERIYWFIENGYVGQSLGDEILNWSPPKPGTYQLRAIDSQGQSTSREVTIEFVP
ncbi:MAG: penicillin-binding protein 1C [Deltaproteobacteria bacterium]|nr:penicillin-binding protein 1C [Deltaproteobacteria bacterium]